MASTGKRWLRDIVAALALIPVALGALALATGDYWYAYSFGRIEPGSTRALVIDRLGEPPVTTEDCYVAQFVDFESPVGWRDNPRVAYCAHWLGSGVATRSFAVGFDAQHRVVGVAYGSS